MFATFLRSTVLALILCLVPAAAQANTAVGDISVRVNDASGNPVEAKVRIFRFGEFNDTTITEELPEGPYLTLSNKAQSAWTLVTPPDNAGYMAPTLNFNIGADQGGVGLQTGMYRIEVSTGPRGEGKIGQQIIYIGPGTSPTITFNPPDLRPIGGAQLSADVAYAHVAVRDGNRDLYDSSRTSGEARLAEHDDHLNDLDTAIDTFRRNNSIPVFRNAAAVRRTISTAVKENLPLDGSRLQNLRVYEDLLRYRAFVERVRQEARTLFRSFPVWPETPSPDATRTRTSSTTSEPNQSVVNRSAKSDLVFPRGLAGQFDFRREGANSRTNGFREDSGLTDFSGSLAIPIYEDFGVQFTIGHNRAARKWSNTDLRFNTTSIGVNPYFRNERFKLSVEFQYNFTDFRANGTEQDQKSFNLGGQAEFYPIRNLTAYGRGGYWELDSNNLWLDGGYGQFGLVGYLLDGNLAINPKGGFTNFESMNGIHFCYREWGADVEYLPPWSIPVSVNFGVHQTELDREFAGNTSKTDKTLITGGFTFYFGEPGGSSNSTATLRDRHRQGPSMNRIDVLNRIRLHL